MIGYLRGRVAIKSPPQLVIDVSGIGYEVEVPLTTCFDLPDVGAEIHIVTHLVVREDQHTLYGFASDAERQLFRDLLKVNRVGAKLALGILSGISVDAFIRCIQEEDQVTLAKLPGVGRKTAERLIIDMRDRIDGQAARSAHALAARNGFSGADESTSRREAYTALTSLGYKPAEARRMLDGADRALRTTEEILRYVLQSAAPTGAP